MDKISPIRREVGLDDGEAVVVVANVDDRVPEDDDPRDQALLPLGDPRQPDQHSSHQQQHHRSSTHSTSPRAHQSWGKRPEIVRRREREVEGLGNREGWCGVKCEIMVIGDSWR